MLHTLFTTTYFGHLHSLNTHSNKYMYVPYFPTDNAHLMYNAHPKLFYIPFEVQITRN